MLVASGKQTAGMLRRINLVFRRWNTVLVVAVLLAVAAALSVTVAVSMEYYVFGKDPSSTAITALITTAVVSTPLTILCVVTIKHLDRSKDRYRRLRDHALAESHAKSQFLANTSHELRTPLNAILGFAQVIEQELFGPVGSPKQKEYIGDIRRSGEHLLGIIDDLLELTRIEAGTQTLDEEELAVSDVLHMALRMTAPRMEEKELDVSVSVPGTLPPLRADRRLLQQIFINLLVNAVKFTPANGRIAIEAEVTAAGELWIFMRDTGIGIAPEHLKTVLEPFGQVETAEARRHGGLGLGLPLVKSMMELHGGRMWLTSRIDHGTTVHLRFPASRIGSDDRALRVVGQEARSDAA